MSEERRENGLVIIEGGANHKKKGVKGMSVEKYCTILEEQVATWEKIAEQRDVPHHFLAKLDRLRKEAEEAKKDVGKRKVVPREAKHGELA